MLSSLALKRSLYVVTQCDFRFACHNEQGLCLGLPARLQDENPGLLQLRLAMRQADLVPAVYRCVVWDEAWENLATMKWPSLTFNSRLNQITLEITSKQAMQTTLVEIHSMMVVRTSSNPLFLTFFYCVRRALKMMLLGLLDRDILAQASQKEDAGQAKLFRIFRAVWELFDFFRIVRLPERAHHLYPSLETCHRPALLQVVPYEDLIYLIPGNLLTNELMDELQGMAEDLGIWLALTSFRIPPCHSMPYYAILCLWNPLNWSQGL